MRHILLVKCLCIAITLGHPTAQKRFRLAKVENSLPKICQKSIKDSIKISAELKSKILLNIKSTFLKDKKKQAALILIGKTKNKKLKSFFQKIRRKRISGLTFITSLESEIFKNFKNESKLFFYRKKDSKVFELMSCLEHFSKVKRGIKKAVELIKELRVPKILEIEDPETMIRIWTKNHFVVILNHEKNQKYKTHIEKLFEDLSTFPFENFSSKNLLFLKLNSKVKSHQNFFHLLNLKKKSLGEILMVRIVENDGLKKSFFRGELGMKKLSRWINFQKLRFSEGYRQKISVVKSQKKLKTILKENDHRSIVILLIRSNDQEYQKFTSKFQNLFENYKVEENVKTVILDLNFIKKVKVKEFEKKIIFFGKKNEGINLENLNKKRSISALSDTQSILQFIKREVEKDEETSLRTDSLRIDL